MFSALLRVTLASLCATALAASSQAESSFKLHPVVSLLGGANFSSLNQDQQISYTVPGNSTVYQNSWWNNSTYSAQTLYGAFLGLELPIHAANLEDPFKWRFGFSYASTFLPTSVSGTTTQGFDNANTTFPYSYQISSYQVLFDNKFLMPWDSTWSAFVTFGVGMASNTAHNYQTPIVSNPSTNNPIHFQDNTQFSFSYEFGLGLEANLETYSALLKGLSLGLSYRYAYWGAYSLGAPSSDPYNSGLPVANTIRLGQSLTTQEAIAELTYAF